MIDVKTAFSAVYSVLEKKNFFLKEKCISIEESRNYILAEDIVADREQPPFNRVAMDGIAISLAGIELSSFQIEGTIGAGEKPFNLKNTLSCLEIMTGAALPENCDLVIPYEMVEIDNGRAKLKEEVELFKNKNIHQMGKDYLKGEVLIPKGKRIKSTDIAVLASIGKETVKICELPQVAIVTTGDELVQIDQVPEFYQIRKSNIYALEAELKSFGFNKVIKEHAADGLNDLKKVLARLIPEAQIIILTGGVSIGKYDYVPKALKELGVNEIFHKVTQRPGKPIWFGENKSDFNNIIFGLPGNPVSCLISLRKYIISSYGEKFKETPHNISLSMDHEFSKKMTLFLPCKLEGGEGAVVAKPIIGNGSGDYFSLTKSDGFLELPADNKIFKKGESFPFYPWNHS